MQNVRECCQKARDIVLKQFEEFKKIEVRHEKLLAEFRKNKISQTELIYWLRTVYSRANCCIGMCDVNIKESPLRSYIFDSQTVVIKKILFKAVLETKDFNNLEFVKHQLDEYLKKINEYEREALAKIMEEEAEEVVC